MWVARESEGLETSLELGSGTDSCGQEDSDRTRAILGRGPRAACFGLRTAGCRAGNTRRPFIRPGRGSTCASSGQ